MTTKLERRKAQHALAMDMLDKALRVHDVTHGFIDSFKPLALMNEFAPPQSDEDVSETVEQLDRTGKQLASISSALDECIAAFTKIASASDDDNG